MIDDSKEKVRKLEKKNDKLEEKMETLKNQ